MKSAPGARGVGDLLKKGEETFVTDTPLTDFDRGKGAEEKRGEGNSGNDSWGGKHVKRREYYVDTSEFCGA